MLDNASVGFSGSVISTGKQDLRTNPKRVEDHKGNGGKRKQVLASGVAVNNKSM